MPTLSSTSNVATASLDPPETLLPRLYDVSEHDTQSANQNGRSTSPDIDATAEAASARMYDSSGNANLARL